MLKKNQHKPSEKLHIIDRSTFEAIQHQSSSASSSAAVRPIRNAKYKKKAKSGGAGVGFNLFSFLKQKPQKTPGKQTRSIFKVKEPFKKRGKTREGVRKKHNTKLKKSILRYRQFKRQQEQQALHLDEALQQLQVLSLSKARRRGSENGEAITRENGVEPSTVHSRRFRAYCDNCTTSRLAELTEQLLRELDRFQKRAFAVNEIKARAHRRFVVGFREVQNFLRIKKIKLTIIAPDCEDSAGEAGLNETIASIKAQCQGQQVPYAFSLRRRQLAYTLYKKASVSCVGILDYDGAREIFAQLLEALQEARTQYASLLQQQHTIAQMHIDTEDYILKK